MEYHKIQSLYKRDEKGKMLFGEYSRPEFAYLSLAIWDLTEKVDGTNIRIEWTGEKVLYKGKTENAQIHSTLITRLIDMFPDELMHSVFDKTPVTLCGEGYGNKIQKVGSSYIKDGVDFILFDVNIGGIYLERKNVQDIADKLNISIVPIVYRGTLDDMEKLCVRGIKSAISEDNTLVFEGIVARPTIELLDRRGERIITKLKCKDFK